MNNSYDDIISRITDPPVWYDENATPRYCEFSPDQVANIYASEAVLLRIECQECGTPFDVSFSRTSYQRFNIAHDYLVYKNKKIPTPEEVGKEAETRRLEDAVLSGQIHYGDPPNNCPEGCLAGATMNSVPRQVLQFWARGRGKDGETEERNGIKGVIKDPIAYMTWKRVPELEREIKPDWVDS